MPYWCRCGHREDAHYDRIFPDDWGPVWVGGPCNGWIAFDSPSGRRPGPAHCTCKIFEPHEWTPRFRPGEAVPVIQWRQRVGVI